MRGRQHRHLGDLLGVRVGGHLGVGEEIGALGGDDERERGELAHARGEPDDVADMRADGAM